MDTSDIMDDDDRQQFARGGVFLLLGGVLVVAFAVLGIEASLSLYAGLVGGSLALAVAALTSDEPLVRVVWFAPGVAAVGVAVGQVFPAGLYGSGGFLIAFGALQVLTAGFLGDR